MNDQPEAIIALRTRPYRPDANSRILLVQLLADGKTIKVAAAELGLTYYSAYRAIERLRYKHKVNNIAQLVAHFLRNGWID